MITEADLNYIAIGGYILYYRGGWDPSGSYFQLNDMFPNGVCNRLVDPEIKENKPIMGTTKL
ncbi:uncharacterized protein PRCAT00005875001 [Priceomyces carsonii]|uniref:uncharacterized protein n=1 Tax=Priceomyces carsonii TaxID=28549 RepID=UPI002ED85506|nr:unnamed protein product [Priceomyces carsonii]